MFACDLDNRLERIGVEQGARGVVRVIDADELSIVGHQSIERVDVDVVAVLAIELKDIDLRTAHLGNRVKLLVGGLDGNYVIARFDERGNNQGVGTGRAVRGHDMPGLDRLIETRDPLEEAGLSLDVSVGESARAQVIEPRLLVGIRKLEQLVEREGVDARLRNVVGALGLPLVHPLLDGEILDLHCRFLSLTFLQFTTVPSPASMARS